MGEELSTDSGSGLNGLERIGLRYVGDGAFVVGIPARDLTLEEVEALGGEEVLMGTGLYERVETREGEKAKGTNEIAFLRLSSGQALLRSSQ